MECRADNEGVVMGDDKTVVDREVGEHIVRLNAAREKLDDANLRDTVDATIFNTRHIGDMCPKIDQLCADVEAVPDAVIKKLNGSMKRGGDMMIPFKIKGLVETELPLKAVIGFAILLVGVWAVLEFKGKGGDILRAVHAVEAMKHIEVASTTVTDGE